MRIAVPAGYRLLPNSAHQPAPYACKAQHELVIANDNLHLFQEWVGFREPHKAQKLEALLNGYKRQLNRERFAVTVAAP
jgi:ribonucleotide reductase class II